MNRVELAWVFGRLTVQKFGAVVAPRRRTYGAERIPREGGCVLAVNHFSWIDPIVVGASSPRPVYFVAKSEAYQAPALGHLIRAFGTIAVRRGESDREAVRLMRQAARDGHPVGLFVEGTRQKSGVLGEVQPGAAMVSIQEGVPVVPAAIHGSQYWRVGNFAPVSIAWGSPLRFDGLPKGGKGYREASVVIGQEIRRLWEWLVEMHELGRPRRATPP